MGTQQRPSANNTHQSNVNELSESTARALEHLFTQIEAPATTAGRVAARLIDRDRDGWRRWGHSIEAGFHTRGLDPLEEAREEIVDAIQYLGLVQSEITTYVRNRLLDLLLRLES